MSQPLQLLTPKQIAEHFQVREITVREWLRRGLLRGVKLGKVWRVSWAAVREFAGPDAAPEED